METGIQFSFKMKHLILPIAIYCCSTTTLLAQKTWNGSFDIKWSVASNWTPAVVPLATEDVIIPSGMPNDPTINGNAVAKTIEVQPGASLTILAAISLTVNGSKAISGNTTAFYNAGKVNNDGVLTIGNTAIVGQYGIVNVALFSNNNGEIKIDNATSGGFYNNTDGKFTNKAKLTIGSNSTIGAGSTVGNYGIHNKAIISNTTGGEISINDATTSGLFNSTGGSFSNSSFLIIGANLSVGENGIRNFNGGTFINNPTGDISINNTTNIGLYNIEGAFTNSGKITIGSTNAVGTNGIRNDDIFNNNVGGDIKIDNSSESGWFQFAGTLNNSATITIGATHNVGNNGLINISTVNNNRGGDIKIDNASQGLTNYSPGNFTNVAKITIGENTSTAGYGLYNFGAIFTNNTGGDIKIYNATAGGIFNTVSGATITNNAKILIQMNNSNLPGLITHQILNNNACASIITNGGLYNWTTGNTLNAGLIQVGNLLSNTHNFTNIGILKYGGLNTGPGEAAILNLGNQAIIVNNTPTPIFTFGVEGDYDGTIDGIFIDNAGNTSAGIYFPETNSFNPNGLVSSGLNILVAKITQSGGCTFLVPFTYTASPLPVRLLSFSGKAAAEGQNILNWITDVETDFAHFEVQRSADTRSFTSVGVVNGSQSNFGESALNTYAFLDASAGQANYYRLKMVDKDGTFAFSKILSIKNTEEKSVVGSFYPNPSTGKVLVDIYAVENGEWTLKVADKSGTVIYSQTQNLQKGMNKITLEKFVPGLNLVQFDNGLVNEFRKLVRK
ncbi:hypothetical protein [Dyadobacter pollutisoli]|uniref:T9SS type A sorting domain-containing protein n=1 Tax=Dyadobacter pollutisoli TaxID=2910158 RepID=A0A9E8NDG5_9BACT|nr:hypothetical protein [Dyadobacter pollutisoli]WAC12981.1 hypothetical protein ON006_03240 [Dyadobacter pollutisoli]